MIAKKEKNITDRLILNCKINEIKSNISYLTSFIQAYQTECYALFEIIEYDAKIFFNRLVCTPYLSIKENFQNIFFSFQSLLTLLVDSNTISTELKNNIFESNCHTSENKFIKNKFLHSTETTEVKKDAKLDILINKNDKIDYKMDRELLIPSIKDCSTDLKNSPENLNP